VLRAPLGWRPAPSDTWSVTGPWKRTWRYVVGLAACLVFGWYAFVQGTRVPFLWRVDLGFHEFGHMVTYWLPDMVTAFMGSITQVAVPLGVALYFFAARKDLLGAGVCLAWAGTSAQNVSVYVADAPYERLELIGGQHDWAFILGPSHLNMLDSASTVAMAVKVFGFALLLAGMGCCVFGLVRERRSSTTESDRSALTPHMTWR
jgi:hypothetical protein